MSKKPDPKKKPSAKPAPAKKVAPKAPLKATPKAKPPVKAKVVVPAKGKAPAANPSAKAAAAKPAPKASLPVKAAKGRAVAEVVNEPKPTGKAGKAGKPAKEPKVAHEVQKKLLETHRKDHHQAESVEAPPRPKLQFYTIAEVQAYLASRKKKGIKLNLWVPEEERKAREKAAAAARSQDHRKHNIAAASIADLLGTNPFRKGSTSGDESKQVPERFRRYYSLLINMRDALQKGLAFHSEAALKKSGKDDAGDLSGYSQHLADAGTDTADRDFALSLISNEQEALKEIADAVERMKKGGYGICEITGKAIPHARLMAVPFTRYSLEGQKELERNRRAHRRRGGNPLGEHGDEVGFGTGGGGGEDDSSDS
jgi:RNA polymerase-binding transcription factor DksA